MATIYPFRALRPQPDLAARVASVPYDVVNTEEARALAEGNPLSFLRVSRAEIELPPSTDPYADAVYDKAAANFARLRDAALTLEEAPSLYFYRLTMGTHVQTGVAACFSIDEYDGGAIKKHERTRRDKEDDRTRHMMQLGAQTGPVFLTYRSTLDVAAIESKTTAGGPLFDFTAADGVRHTLWRASDADRDAIVRAFARIPALYIADGHHRAASAARTRAEMKKTRATATSLGDGADFNTVLAVAFPHDQMQVLPYNRIVKDLAGLSPAQFLAEVEQRFLVSGGLPAPSKRGEISMYVDGTWRTLKPRVAPDASDAIASLDVSVLQDGLLGPVLKIADVRTDKRIDFVGGARGTKALEDAVKSGKFAVAFSMFPVSVADLMAVSDAGAIMPPKSTWFEPKLRDGLLSHLI
jgi:uncharacterized protein (DUF1015 family)